jgi:peptidyl-prolyl cis-trans isomerase SurA
MTALFFASYAAAPRRAASRFAPCFVNRFVSRLDGHLVSHRTNVCVMVLALCAWTTLSILPSMFSFTFPAQAQAPAAVSKGSARASKAANTGNTGNTGNTASSANSASAANSAATVLATVGNEKVTYAALEEAYKKNMTSKTTPFAQLPADSVREFLNLYVNYRLKVQDAIARGLLDRAIVNPNVDTIAARRRFKFKVGLILSTIKAGEDSTRAYKRSLAIINLITKQKKDFIAVLKDSTNDEYGKQAGGDYGWLTSGTLVRQIEDIVCAKLKVGDVWTQPVRTPEGGQAGYFVVKLLALEPHISVLGRQIVVPFRDRDSVPHSVTKSTADSIANIIKTSNDKSGEVYARLARELSTERVSGERGGLFNTYYSELTGYADGNNRYKIRPAIVSALESVPDGTLVAEPVETELGYHVLRRDSSKQGADEREALKRLYKQGGGFEADKKAFIESIQKKQSGKTNPQALAAFLSAVDSVMGFNAEQARMLPTKLLGETLFSFGSANFSVERFRDSLLKSSAVRGYTMNRRGVEAAISKLRSDLVLESMLGSLEKTYPEFATLMREFHDGILIFRVEEQEIWSKMKFDTVRARAYHDTIKTRFQMPVRYDLSEILVNSDSLAQALRKRPDLTVKFDSLASALTVREGFKPLKGKWGPVEVWQSVVVEPASKLKVGEFTKVIPYDKGYGFVRLNAVIAAHQKTFEEAIPDFAAPFQDMMQKELTQKWLTSLRQKFPVSIDQPTIDKLWKRG